MTVIYHRALHYQEVSSCSQEQHEGLEEENLQVSVRSGHIEWVKVRTHNENQDGSTYPPLELDSVSAFSILADIFGCTYRDTFKATMTYWPTAVEVRPSHRKLQYKIQRKPTPVEGDSPAFCTAAMPPSNTSQLMKHKAIKRAPRPRCALFLLERRLVIMMAMSRPCRNSRE